MNALFFVNQVSSFNTVRVDSVDRRHACEDAIIRMSSERSKAITARGRAARVAAYKAKHEAD